MFAGPNGSGKSELKRYLRPELLGVYLNPDEIEKEVREQGFIDFTKYGVATTAEQVLEFFTNSSFLNSAGFGNASSRLSFSDGRLNFGVVEVNAYFASVLADFLRQKLLEHNVSFTFETVMSHESKVGILKQAQALGYRTYLYYVATDDPEINISRVRTRVSQGGHDVRNDLIVSRYKRSIDLLFDAIHHTNRAYVFDNSVENKDRTYTWLVEITDGKELEFQTDDIPAWFKHAVLDKILPSI